MTRSKEKLKILLIQPSNIDCVKSLFSIYNSEGGIGLKPPIGLLHIATAIKTMTGHAVEILDCQLEGVHSGNILDYVKQDYDVIGLSAWTDFWFQTAEMGKKLKKQRPETHLVLGGPHVNIFPEEVLSFPWVDAIVMGDGEIPLVRLLEFLTAKKQQPTAIPGVYFRGRKYSEYLPYTEEDLDKLPIPDRTLLPLQRYTSVLSSSDYVTAMVTSRGCPYQCVYCKLRFQKPVSRSAESVVAEFQAIANLGIKEVEVYDDTFNWSAKRTKDICRGIIEKKIKLKWSIRDRVNKVKEETLVDLKNAGCYRIHFGIESGSNRVLRLCKKGITTEQARKAVSLAKKHGFLVLTYFMFGLPGETREEARSTIDYSLEIDSDYVEYSITIPYPGTELYLKSLEEGIIPFDYWREFTLNPTPSFLIPYVIENHISKSELVELRNLAIRKFYFRPRYLVKELSRVRSWHEFIRKATMGLGLFNILRGKLIR